MEKLELLNSGSQELLWGVLCKNLHCGLSTKGVNRAFPGLITETLVQLAHKFLPDKDYNFYGKTFGWSYKLDGLRCTAQRRDGKWKLISRKGKPIVTANHIIPDLEHLYNLTKFTFFDGELYKHGLKFETIQGNVMRRLDPHAAEGLEFRVFIAFDIESFEAKVTPRRWMTTFPSTDTVLPVSLGESISLSEIREHVTLIDTEGYPEVEKRYPESPIVRAISQGYEGIMLRSPLYPYDYKRSHALMKVKVMDSTDCKVLAVEGGSFPIIENGEQKEIVTLLKLVVLQPNGITCKPGTGFDLTFRRFWWEHADELVGKTVEIFHQGYGTDHRMRFPVFSRIREDK